MRDVRMKGFAERADVEEVERFLAEHTSVLGSEDVFSRDDLERVRRMTDRISRNPQFGFESSMQTVEELGEPRGVSHWNLHWIECYRHCKTAVSD